MVQLVYLVESLFGGMGGMGSESCFWGGCRVVIVMQPINYKFAMYAREVWLLTPTR